MIWCIISLSNPFVVMNKLSGKHGCLCVHGWSRVITNIYRYDWWSRVSKYFGSQCQSEHIRVYFSSINTSINNYINTFLSSLNDIMHHFIIKSLHYQIPSFISKSTCVLLRVNTGEHIIFSINVLVFSWIYFIIKSSLIKSIHYQIPSFLKTKVHVYFHGWTNTSVINVETTLVLREIFIWCILCMYNII